MGVIESLHLKMQATVISFLKNCIHNHCGLLQVIRMTSFESEIYDHIFKPKIITMEF